MGRHREVARTNRLAGWYWRKMFHACARTQNDTARCPDFFNTSASVYWPEVSVSEIILHRNQPAPKMREGNPNSETRESSDNDSHEHHTGSVETTVPTYWFAESNAENGTNETMAIRVGRQTRLVSLRRVSSRLDDWSAYCN